MSLADHTEEPEGMHNYRYALICLTSLSLGRFKLSLGRFKQNKLELSVLSTSTHSLWGQLHLQLDMKDGTLRLISRPALVSNPFILQSATVRLHLILTLDVFLNWYEKKKLLEKFIRSKRYERRLAINFCDTKEGLQLTFVIRKKACN